MSKKIDFLWYPGHPGISLADLISRVRSVFDPPVLSAAVCVAVPSHG